MLIFITEFCQKVTLFTHPAMCYAVLQEVVLRNFFQEEQNNTENIFILMHKNLIQRKRFFVNYLRILFPDLTF